ncbi:MAG: glycerophosphodiester phosphodiesterase [Alteromonadales bacterium]|nr:glycerophosphodiester phosphodiesterase [Alteromonadales bacterium]
MKKLSKLFFLMSSTMILTACNDDNNSDTNNVVNMPEATLQPSSVVTTSNVQLGSRPYFLIADMQDSALKTKLQSCSEGPFYQTEFSIGHRGAALQYPEHTKESYIAAARMGAGIIECDVTFTKDKELVCRHSQCDLHSTTNILAIPELAAKCSVPFTPADPENAVVANAQCCTSDITLAEFSQLQGKMDAVDTTATTVEQYMQGTADWRTDLYASKGTVMTHAQSIALFKELGVKMTPELKTPSVVMPFVGMTQQDFAQKMLDEYTAANVPASDVYPQSFNLEDIKYWIINAPDFAEQAVFLDGRYDDPSFDYNNVATWQPSMAQLVADNVKIIAPPMWMLLALDAQGKIVASEYAKRAKAAGLGIITWTLERSGPLLKGGGWYYQSVTDAINNDGDQFIALDVLANEVGVMGVFADWPGTVSYYASCMAMPASHKKI